MLLRRVTLSDGVWYQVGDLLRDDRIEKIILSEDAGGYLEALIFTDAPTRHPSIVVPYHSIKLYFPLQTDSWDKGYRDAENDALGD